MLQLNLSSLFVIIPTTRGIAAFPTIASAINQQGFRTVTVLICGESALDNGFRVQCQKRFGTNIRVLSGPIRKPILPGEARNIGLDYIREFATSDDYVLFVDDDIRLPSNYSIMLCRFLQETSTVAAMGRIVSYPVNIWSKVIDYSNFWWLQLEKNCTNLGCLGAGATLLKFDDMNDIRFPSDIAVNEDTVYFSQLQRQTGKTLGICASITCRHCHNRGSLVALAKYQFANGSRGTNYRHGKKGALTNSLRRWKNNSMAAIRANATYMRTHRIEMIGVVFSFFIMECGSLYASYRIKQG